MTPIANAVVFCRTLLLAVALGATAGMPGAAERSGVGAVSVKQLLERMVAAIRNRDYSGTFVYLHNNRLAAMEIVHIVVDGEERERLLSLNGSGREVVRDMDSVTCVMPDQGAISVEPRGPSVRLWRFLQADLDGLDGYYGFYALGEARVAGRATGVVGIVPRDEFRYGYRFYLDRESGLPLKSDLMDESATPVEQIMFTSLSLTPDDPPSLLAEGTRKFSRTDYHPTVEHVGTGDSSWEFDGLPAGFAIKVHNRIQDDSGQTVEHFLVSDGLASMSVYVGGGSDSGLDGHSHIGAVNAWGGKLAGRQVTVVGEVPKVTVRRVFESIRPPREPDPR